MHIRTGLPLALVLMISSCSCLATLAAEKSPNQWDEVLSTDFDGRKWVPGWQHKDENNYTLELVPTGQTVDNWKEMVTVTFFPGLQNKATPHQMMDQFLSRLKKYGATAKLISETSDTIIFEWSIAPPLPLAQYELDKIVAGQNGLHFLHYASKVPNPQQQELWLANFKKAHIIRRSELHE